MWTAETTDGPAPYTYEWRIDDVVVSRRHWLVHSHPAPAPLVLKLRVFDATGGWSEASLTVPASDTSPVCAVQE